MGRHGRHASIPLVDEERLPRTKIELIAVAITDKRMARRAAGLLLIISIPVGSVAASIAYVVTHVRW